MLSRKLLVLPLILVPCALAQFGHVDNYGTLRVRIVFSDGRRCAVQLHVVLMGGSSNNPVVDTYTNNECMADFASLAVGDYHMVISGEGVEETDSGLFSVDARKSSQSLFVTVKRKNEGEAAVPPGSPMIAAADMNVPDHARQEYEKVAAPFAKGDWKKAKEQLLKAIAIYPQYAAAYNDLGVVYGRLGDRAHEREALQKAVAINDHFSEAYMNLGKMAIADHDFPQAEGFLEKATSSDPNNPQALMLLADVQLMDKHYDQSIASCRKAHSMPHKLQSLVHYIAARAFMHENRPSDAAAELQIFLTEEPSGPRADAVRAELGQLEKGVN